MAEAERIAHFGVWRWDPAIQQVHMSQELSAIHGIEPLPMRPGRVLLDAVHPDDRQRVQEALEHARTTREPFAFTERIVRPDGAIREAHVHGRPITAPDGTLRGLVGVVHDITEREQAERALGLNRRRMRAIIDHSPSAISVKNLDGRYVLANTATGRLLGMAPDDIVGRPCSELFPEIAEEQLARDSRALEQSGPVFDESVLHRSGEPRTYETVTFALPDETGRIAETCTIATDVTERRELESERLVRLEWARRIETALAEGRMIVYAQPIVEIATGRATGAELLVRMETADAPRGILGPDAFLPAAERYGLVQAIDTWMVGRALELARSFAPRVNLSAVTMSDPDARREILDRLRGAPEAAARLVFEITETAEPEHLDHAERFASDLTEFGCGLALDDFGTGFGSFTYLRRLPVRYLKIDRSFVADLLASSSDRRVVQSIVSVAEQFGLQAIAEGVEDAVTLTLLSELGTHYAQGFHLGRPAPAEDEAQAGSRFQS
jgi:PAS domain S-box-containing protein